MAGLPPHPAAADATRVGPDRGSPPRTPRWVKVFGIIVLVLALLFVVSQFAGGNHSPGRHLPSNTLESDTVPFAAIQYGAHQ